MTQSSNFAPGGTGFVPTEQLLTEQAEARTLDQAEMADDAEAEEEAPADTQSDAVGEALSVIAPSMTPQRTATPSPTVTAARTATPPSAPQGLDDAADTDTAAGAPPAPAVGGGIVSPSPAGTQPRPQTAVAQGTTTATMEPDANDAIAAQVASTESPESDGAASGFAATGTAVANDVATADAEVESEDESGFSALDLLGAALVAVGILAVIAVVGMWAAGGDRNMSETDRLAP